LISLVGEEKIERQGNKERKKKTEIMATAIAMSRASTSVKAAVMKVKTRT
jgi:hypothetical protein